VIAPNAKADVCISNPSAAAWAQTSAGPNRSKPFIEDRTKSGVGRQESRALAWDAWREPDRRLLNINPKTTSA
jgi:hypothetical protein